MFLWEELCALGIGSEKEWRGKMPSTFVGYNDACKPLSVFVGGQETTSPVGAKGVKNWQKGLRPERSSRSGDSYFFFVVN